MPRGEYIWLDGELVKWSDAKVHVMAHALHYGSAAFEGIRSYSTGRSTVVFRLDDHLRRFQYSMDVLGMVPRYTLDELRDAVITVVKANRLGDGYIRPIAFYSMDDYLGIDLSRYGDKYSVAIGGWNWGKYLGGAYEKGSRVKISRWRRLSKLSVPMDAKICGYYANSVIARLEGGREYDEVLMLDEHGFVVEGSGENIFIVSGSEIYTPPESASILPGITRDTVIRLIRDELGKEVVEKNILVSELLNADEVFMVGTAAEVTPVVEVDNILIGDGAPGVVTKDLQKLYYQVVRGKIDKYSDWITIVDIGD